MKKMLAVLFVVLLCAVGPAYAVYSFSDKGEWPATWPKELEPLRKQARTFVGPTAPNRHYAITFTKREEMEAAWPHLLKAKTKGAPIFLVRDRKFFLGDKAKGGVIVHSPPAAQTTPEAPIKGYENPRITWMYASYIELVVDGEIVDLNRLALPEDSPIVDERFKDEKKK